MHLAFNFLKNSLPGLLLVKCPAGVLSVHCFVRCSCVLLYAKAEWGVSSCLYIGPAGLPRGCFASCWRSDAASSEVDLAPALCSLVAGESPVEPRKFTSSPSRADGQTRGLQNYSSSSNVSLLPPLCPTLPNPSAAVRVAQCAQASAPSCGACCRWWRFAWLRS